MKIINLTQTQFRNYSNIHHQRNFSQTVEYSRLPLYSNYEKYFLGLVDNSNNVLAATLILVKNISSTVRKAYAPNGYLIDYSDFDLVKIFTEELIKYLKKEKITYLITDPKFKYRVYNKKNIVIENNTNLLENLYRLNYINTGYENDFGKYDIVIEDKYNPTSIYRMFNRNTRRNIKENLDLGITLHKASINEINIFYDVIKKKTSKSDNYYYNLINTFNTKDNKMEIFFAKLEPEIFLMKAKKLYEMESRKNERIYNRIQNRFGKMTEKTLNIKINSDKTLEKYHQLLNNAINLYQTNKDSIVIGTCAIIKNNKEIYFLIDGYKEEFRYIHSTHILKWALIKKYSRLGYKKFNLGEINLNYLNKDNKYHGQYMYKIGFGGNIIEYPPTLLLVINKPVYNTYMQIKKIKSKMENIFKK